MKTTPYELAGDIPSVLKGIKIETRVSETLDDMHLLVQDGKPDNVRYLAQAQFNIIIQRQIRNFLDSADVATILNGGTVAEGEYAGDYSAHTEQERIDLVVAEANKIGATWVYGGRAPSAGGSAAVKVAKEKAAKFDVLTAAAAADPKLADKLAKLGISL